MNNSDKFGLRPVWTALLEIYKEFAKVCDEHHLCYYGFAGTALGAVRHNGFIPWDDDLDVAMPRPDYEKFVEIASQALPSHLKFVYWKNTPELNLLAGKIQDTREQFVRDIEARTGRVLSNGLFVDVYPIDGYPSGVAKLRAKIELFVLLQLMWRYRVLSYNELSIKGKLAWIVGKVVSILLPKVKTKAKIMEICEQILLRTPFEKSDYVGDIGYSMSIFLHPRLPKRIWGTPVMHKFEELYIPLPADVDAHLRNNYGDYMSLPPEEKRCPSHSLDYHFPWWLGPTMPEGERPRG